MREFSRKLIALIMLIALLGQSTAAAVDVGAAPEEPAPTGIPEEQETEPPGPEEKGPAAESETPGLERTVMRIGLYYGSNVLDGANLSNHIGAGFLLGYYDDTNDFIRVGQITAGSISMVRTENVGYGSQNGYTSYYTALAGTTAVTVGCYHLQTPESYEDFESAAAVASEFTGGFVAWLSGTYRVRIGNYTDRDAALSAQEELAAAAGISSEIKGTSAYGVSVVATGTADILFQFDDNGSGTGLGVEPCSSEEGETCVTWFRNTRWYGGFRYERINGGGLTVVNMVALDDYVKGILPYEMSASWPSDALKAQAVCARSYSLASRNGKHRGYHFNLCNTNCCQVYLGLGRANENSDAAVDETRGMVARYGEKIATCFYYSSNGGASEASSTVWGGNQSTYPYLLGVIDPYEATVADQIGGYNWTRTYSASDLTDKLNAKGYKCATIKSVKVSSYTDTGNPKTVTFTDADGKNYTLTARAMVTMLSLRSYHYDFGGSQPSGIPVNEDTVLPDLSGLYAIDGDGNLVPVSGDAYIITEDGTQLLDTGGEVSGESFTITGSGYGHNVGMSQWGAYAMAKQGLGYEDILCFYYTGITVGK